MDATESNRAFSREYPSQNCMAVLNGWYLFLPRRSSSQKHNVMLFSSADSRTKAHVVPAYESALRLSSRPIVDPMAHYVRLLELVFHQVHEFDALHFHIDYLHFPLARRQSIPAGVSAQERINCSLRARLSNNRTGAGREEVKTKKAPRERRVLPDDPT